MITSIQYLQEMSVMKQVVMNLNQRRYGTTGTDTDRSLGKSLSKTKLKKSGNLAFCTL